MYVELAHDQCGLLLEHHIPELILQMVELYFTIH